MNKIIQVVKIYLIAGLIVDAIVVLVIVADRVWRSW